MSSPEDAAGLRRLRDIYAAHLRQYSAQPMLDERMEDSLAGRQADQAAQQFDAELPSRDRDQHFLSSPNPFDPPAAGPAQFADGGWIEPSTTAYFDGGRYSAPNQTFQTPPSDAAALEPPAQVYGEGGLVFGGERLRNLEKWLKNSVLRNNSGAPIVHYHGSAREFDEFDPTKFGTGAGSEPGLFFTSKPQVASRFAELLGGLHGSSYPQNLSDNTGSVYPMYLRAQKPFLSDMVHYDEPQMFDELQQAQELGHDSILFPKMRSSGEAGTVAVFDPRQAKSVFNRGTYDSDDPRFMYARGGPYREPGFHNLPNSMPQSGPMHYGSDSFAGGGRVSYQDLIDELHHFAPRDYSLAGDPPREAPFVQMAREFKESGYNPLKYVADSALRVDSKLKNYLPEVTPLGALETARSFIDPHSRDDYGYPGAVLDGLAIAAAPFSAAGKMMTSGVRGLAMTAPQIVDAATGAYHWLSDDDSSTVHAAEPQHYGEGGKVASNLAKYLKRELLPESSSRLPAYLRFGDWPASERSGNYIDGGYERGVSVYPLHVGPGGVQPEVPASGPVMDLWDRLDDKSTPRYLVEGRAVGRGADGEPLLRDVRKLGPYHESSGLYPSGSEVDQTFWPGASPRQPTSPAPFDNNYAGGGRVSEIGRAIAKMYGSLQGARFEHAGDVANLDRFSDKGLRDLFDPAKSGLLAAMPPSSFQDYALPLPSSSADAVPYPRWKNVPNGTKFSRGDRTQDQYLDKLAQHIQSNGLDEPASLWLHGTILPGTTSIEGHEGRHRMMALDRLGDQSSLVHMLPANQGEMRFDLPDRLEYLQDKYFPRGALTPVYPEPGFDLTNATTLPSDPFAGGGPVHMAEGGFLTQLARHVIGKPSSIRLPSGEMMGAHPIKEFEDVASKFAAKNGNDYPITRYPEFDADRAKKIAQAYDDMKHDPTDPRVKRAYDALIDETMDQYRALKGTGVDFSFLKPGEADPYAATPSLGYKDLIDNGRLKVFPTDQGFGTLNDIQDNPMLRKVGPVGDLPNGTANDAFRIVHDSLGHFGPGNPFFRQKGEERAWNAHARSYSPAALPAATSETRGQNSWVNSGPHAEHNATASGADTVYADQKTGLLPEWAYSPDDTPHYAGGGEVVETGLKKLASWRTRAAQAMEDAKLSLNKGNNKPSDAFVSPDVSPRLQTVDDPRRAMFPLIYSDPRDIAQWARQSLAPDQGKDGAMYRLFGHTRDSLDELSQSNRPFDIPRPSTPDRTPFLAPARGTGSPVSDQVLTRRNAGRILDVLDQGMQDDKLRPMRSWYEMDPLYDYMDQLGVSDRGKQALNARMGVMSPASSPTAEIPRGFMANYLAEHGRLEDFIRYGGLTDEQKQFPGFPQDMESNLGHAYHDSMMPNLIEHEALGRLWPSPDTHKVASYIAATDPISPLWDRPVADSHFARMLGYPDVRGAKTIGSLRQQLTNPEYAAAYPWWNDKVAGAMDERPRDMQALSWGMFGPTTGVRKIGPPKLEMISDYMDEVAKARGIAPEDARDQLLTGEIGGKARGGPVDDFDNQYQSQFYAAGGSVDDDDLLYHPFMFDRGGFFRGQHV